MKIYKIILPMMIVSLYGCGVGSSSIKNNTPQEAIKTLFEAIKNNDVEAFQHMIAKKEDVISWVESFVTDSSQAKELKVQALEILKSDTIMIKQFNRVRSEGEADGIEDWGQLVFKKAEYENKKDGSHTVKYSKAEFTYKGEYISTIRLGTLIKSGRGWVLQPSYDMKFLKMFPLNIINN